MLIAGAASQASECTTVMSPIDPGQHNDEIIGALLGHTEAELHQLRAEGVL